MQFALLERAGAFAPSIFLPSMCRSAGGVRAQCLSQGRAAGVVSKREEGDLLSTEEVALDEDEDEEEMARTREIEKQG